MNDELQGAIGALVKAVAFYIAVLAMKELIPLVQTYLGHFSPLPQNQQNSTSENEPKRS